MQPADCIIMTERKDAVDFLATRDKIVEAINSAYARGLADGRKEAANIPADSIMLPDGRVVRVLGTLPMTADECVPTYGGFVYCPKGGKAHVHETDAYCTDTCCWSRGCQGDSGSGEHHPFSKCYSTRAAAEAAKEAKQ